jgi:hypothetical protein
MNLPIWISLFGLLSGLVTGGWALAGWLRQRRREKAEEARRQAAEQIPVHPRCRCTLTVIDDVAPARPSGELEAAMQEFTERMQPLINTGPAYPAVHLELDREGRVHAGPLCPPKLLEALEYHGPCPECGRRPPKHRHSCSARRRN